MPIFKKIAEQHYEKVIEQLIIECPEKVIEQMIAACPEKAIEQVVERCSEGVIESVIEQHLKETTERCLDKQTELIKESSGEGYTKQFSDEKSDGIAQKLADILVDIPDLFVKILSAINKLNPQLLEKVLESDLQLARTIWMYVGASQEVLLGAVGKVEYSASNKYLNVAGYFLPSEAYDTIEIFHKGKGLGCAQLNIKRPDVYKKIPNYHNLYSGWKFEMEVDGLAEGEEIEVLVKRNGDIVRRDIQRISVVQREEEITIRNYKIEMPNLLEHSAGVYERVRRFNEVCTQLENWFDWGSVEFYQKFISLQSEIMYGTKKIEEILLSIFSDKENKIIHFIDAQMEYQDINRLWTIINELLIEEEYYFETDKSMPMIIDGGANIGLAIYYFKTRFPQCRILAFEPSGETYAVLKRNVERNNWENVEVLPYALDAEEGTQTLYIPIEDCLGASLTKRPFEYNDEQMVKIELINTKKLNDYIDKKIDFLKLDVEGVETRIIRGLGDKLKYVKHIFLEYHYGNMVEDNDLLELLGMLEKQGIYYQIAKSPGFTISTSHKTMNYVGSKYSLNIWGKQM